MVKRLLTLCAVALMGVAVMASPERMQKKDGKRDAAKFTPMAVTMPTSTKVALPENAMRATTRQKVQVAPAKTIAASNWNKKPQAKLATDTVKLLLSKLPYTIEGTLGDANFNRAYMLVADTDALLMTTCVANQGPATNVMGVFDVATSNPIALNGYARCGQFVSKGDTLLLELAYNSGTYSGGAFSVTFEATQNVVDSSDPATYTMQDTTIPFEVKGAQMPDTIRYIYGYTISSLQIYYPLGCIYHVVADADTTYALRGTNIINVTNPSSPALYDQAANFVCSAGENLYIAISSETDTYDFSISAGALPQMEVLGIEYDKVTLPYSVEAARTTQYSDVFANPIHAYEFTLADSSLLLINHTSSVSSRLYEPDMTYYEGFGISDTLAPGTYYVIVDGPNATTEFNLSIHAVDLAFEAAPTIAYYEADYTNTIAVGEMVTGKINYYTTPFMSDAFNSGNAVCFSAHLTPGFYKASGLIQTLESWVNCGVGVLTCEKFTEDFDQDTLTFANNYSWEKSAIGADAYFHVTKDSVYRFYVITSWFQSYDVNYSFVINQVIPEPFALRTIPFTLEGDMNTGALVDYDDKYNAFTYFYVPKDTLVEVSLQVSNTNFDDCAILINHNHDNPIGAYDDLCFDVWTTHEATRAVKLSEGEYYLMLATYKLEDNLDYKITVSYLNKTLVTDTITVPQLLANASKAELGEQELFLGVAPTSLVKDLRNSGYAYYAMAYKLVVDSGQRILFSQNAAYDEYVHIFQQQADTIRKVADWDDYNGVHVADSTTTYYVVFSSYYDASIDFGSLKYTLNVSDVEPAKIEELLATVTKETKALKETTLTLDSKSATLVQGEDGRFLWNDYDAYAFAYKLKVDSGKQIHCTYTSDEVDNFIHIYYQAGDTILQHGGADFVDDIYFEIDTTTTYYVVFTTYSAMETGKITISYAVEDIPTMDDVLAAAVPLTELRGTVELGESFYFDSNYHTACKVDLDSAQHIKFWYLPSECYRLQADTFALYTKTNVKGLYYADNAATYYFVFADPYELEKEQTYELSIDVWDNWDNAQLTTLPIVIADTLESFVSAWEHHANVDETTYATTRYDFALNKGNEVGMLYRSTSTTMEAKMYDKKDTTIHLKFYGDEAGFAIDTADYNTTYQLVAYDQYDGGEVNMVVHYIYPSLDSLMKATMNAKPAETLPYICSGVVSDWVNQAWYRSEDEVLAAQMKKVHLKVGERLDIVGTYGMKSRVSIYGCDGSEFVYLSGRYGWNYSYNYTATVDADYVIVFTTFDGVNTSMWENTTDYELSIVSLTAPAEVVKVAADCDYIDVAQIDEMHIKAALSDLVLTATTDNGSVVTVDNKITHWTINADSTKAQYVVELDKGYTYAENADSVVTVLINPAKVTAIAGENGEISPEGTRIVCRNTTLTYTITADKGYVISKILVNGVARSADCLNKNEGEFTLKATQNTTIEVEFKSTTAVSSTELANVVVYGRDRMIVVDGAEANSEVRIFTLTGSIIYAGRTTSTYEQYAVPTSGLYIIRIADKATKVIVK